MVARSKLEKENRKIVKERHQTEGCQERSQNLLKTDDVMSGTLNWALMHYTMIPKENKISGRISYEEMVGRNFALALVLWRRHKLAPYQRI